MGQIQNLFHPCSIVTQSLGHACKEGNPVSKFQVNARHDPRARAACGFSQIVIGRGAGECGGRSMGFGGTLHGEPGPEELGDLICDADEGHILAIAPTGAGKGRNLIIPNLVSYAGPAIVLDPKGENYRVTSRIRRAMGQRVVLLDAFGVIGEVPDGFNVFDDLDPESADFEADCVMKARCITSGQRSHNDPFWDQNAEALFTGLIAYVAEYMSPERRHLGTLRSMLCADDFDYSIAVILDTTLKDKECLAADEFKNFLGHEREKVRTSVRSSCMQHMLPFAGPQVQAALSRSSFDLAAITAGDPVTIYIVVPPHKLEAYAALLRIWVSTLLALITRRTAAPELPTLLVLDELAQLGAFPLLKPAVTLMRGYGLRCMLLLQDIAQLKTLFGADHATIVNNCATVLTFGHTSYAMSREMSELLGDMSADALFGMSRNRMVMRRAGEHSQIMQRLDYLTDPLFAGRFDANPLARRLVSLER